MRSPRWMLGIGGTVLLAVLTAWAEDTPSKPPAGPKSPSVPKSEPGKSPGRGLDALKLPDGAMIVIGKDAADILQQMLNRGVLTADDLTKLREQIRDKPAPPGACLLSGTVDGDVVHLRAEFAFETEKPKSRIALGCQKAWPTGAKLDESGLPLLSALGDEGYVVQVPTPGKHKLTLDMDVLVDSKGTERGFEIGLPHAAITRLEQFDLPPQVSEVRVSGRGAISAKSLNSKNAERERLALGPLDSLKVSWKGPAPQQQAGPLLEAIGQIEVDIDDTQITTKADLSLQSRRGPVDQWRLQLPPQARVEVKDERTATVTPPADPNKLPVWAIQLSEPSAEPFRVIVRVQQPRPKTAPGSPAPAVPVGPFYLLNAFSQRGSISISAPTDVRLQFRTHGDISPSEFPDDQRREGGANTVAAFNYRSLPAPANPTQPPLTPLEITVETVKGAVESRLEHTFSLRADRTWQVATKIEITPIRTAVDSFVVRLPPGYHYDREVGPSPANLVEEVLVPEGEENQARDGHVRLVQPRRSDFSVTLVGIYKDAGNDGQHMALPLPQVRGTLDRGGRVRATVREGTQVSLQGADFKSQQADAGPSERAPARVDLAWRRYRPELPVDVEADVTLTERQARIWERIRFKFSTGPMKQVLLHLPTGLVPKVKGGKPPPIAADTWQVTLQEPVGKEHLLSLDYSVPVPSAGADGQGEQLAIPLVWPEEATDCVTKVRVFSDPGIQPALLGDGRWSEEQKEAVAGRTSLPSLVLLGRGLELPLNLRLARSAVPLLPAVVVDRLLIQVALAEGGYQTYRARFLISKLTQHELELELPSSPASLKLSVLLNGNQLPKLRVVDENGNESETGRIIRFLDLEPALYENGCVLDVGYKLAAGRQQGNGRWHSTLYPPRLRGNAFLGEVRWQLAVPPGWLPLSFEETFSAEQHWGLKGWLPGPCPAVNGADLEHWFYSSLDSAKALDAGSRASTAATDFISESGDVVVGWQSSLAALRIYHVPQRAWLLACSLTFVVCGLGLYFARLSRGFYWLVVVGLALAAVLAGIWWPSVLPAVIYGCVPGAVVVAAVLGIQWMLQRRYRRQVVFMPGFSRLKPGSSLLRPGSSNRSRGEPSTVDQPPGSGQRALGPGQKAESSAP